jgi:hypothetical protein
MRDAFPGRRDPLSASSCRGQGNGRRHWLGVRLLTLSVMVKVLVRKRWVTKRRSVTVIRVVHLRLSRRGNALALQIEQRVRQGNATLAEQDRRTLGMNPKGSHA